MDKKNLMPQAAQPVNRTTTGQLPESLAELSEEALCHWGSDASSEKGINVMPSRGDGKYVGGYFCSYDGDDAE